MDIVELDRCIEVSAGGNQYEPTAASGEAGAQPFGQREVTDVVRRELGLPPCAGVPEVRQHNPSFATSPSSGPFHALTNFSIERRSSRSR